MNAKITVKAMDGTIDGVFVIAAEKKVDIGNLLERAGLFCCEACERWCDGPEHTHGPLEVWCEECEANADH